MKLFISIVFIFLLNSIVSGQQNEKSKFIKLSFGRVAFGTGDFFGYSFSTELSKNLNNQKHINVGLEATIENGKVQPDISDVFTAFNQVSNASLTPKLNYYPFNKIIKGFNIGLGPTLGYQFKSEESQWSILYDTNGNPYLRRSILKYTNNFFVGYRISINYDFTFKNKFLLGLRSDFSNYNNGDINTLLSIKAGFIFK